MYSLDQSDFSLASFRPMSHVKLPISALDAPRLEEAIAHSACLYLENEMQRVLMQLHGFRKFIAGARGPGGAGGPTHPIYCKTLCFCQGLKCSCTIERTCMHRRSS